MRKLFAGVLLAMLALTAFASSASACLNDREVGTSEREFKSSYIDQQGNEPVSPGQSLPPGENGQPVAAIAGLILLAGAGVLGLMKPGNRC
jgi:LPXTG-motif cell wall-anchored protein